MQKSDKVDAIKYAKANPSIGAWKVADKFEIGRAQVQTILQKKESLLMSFESHKEPQTNLKWFRTRKSRCYGSDAIAAGVPTYLSQEECFKRRLRLLLKT